MRFNHPNHGMWASNEWTQGQSILQKPGAEQQRRLSDVKLQKLKQLEVHSRGITDFSGWLDDPNSRKKFKGKVYGPILCEIAVDNGMNAAYLEQHCPSAPLSSASSTLILPSTNCHKRLGRLFPSNWQASLLRFQAALTVSPRSII